MKSKTLTESHLYSMGFVTRGRISEVNPGFSDWEVFSISFGWFKWKKKMNLNDEQVGWFKRGWDAREARLEKEHTATDCCEQGSE